MDIGQPALIANIPSLQKPLVGRLGGHTFQHVEIGGNAHVHLGDVISQSGSESQQCKEQPFTVPFSRDDNFIPRGVIVDELMMEVKADKHSRAALYGLGGVGKTQVAIEFAYSFREMTDAAVFWLFAGTAERLLESFARIAAD